MKSTKIHLTYGLRGTRYEALAFALADKLNQTKGKHGIQSRRALAQATLDRIAKAQREQKEYQPFSLAEHEARDNRRKLTGLQRAAVALAKKADMHFDEHGSGRGDFLNTRGLDFVPPARAAQPPCFDMGGAGLALIETSRERVYAKSSNWRPSVTSTRYLIGRNESGTWFAHAVARTCDTVIAALDWIWNGKAGAIIARQGDIALIRTGRGPARLPDLPAGHTPLDDHLITHAQHPAIPYPKHGQAIIIGRRATVRVANETRD